MDLYNNDNSHKNEKNNHKNDELDKQYERHTPEIPVTVDRRAPQFNDANNGCHCGCPCMRGSTDSDANGAGGDASAPLDINGNMVHDVEIANSETSSEHGDEVMNYDEGVEGHLIEVGDLGMVSISLIQRSLARHSRCTCHVGTLPGDEDYPFTGFNSPSASGFLSPDDSASMMAEAGSPDQSMASSMVLSNVSTRGSSLLGAMGGAFTPVPIFRPLSLTPEVVILCPIELDIDVKEFPKFDMW